MWFFFPLQKFFNKKVIAVFFPSVSEWKIKSPNQTVVRKLVLDNNSSCHSVASTNSNYKLYAIKYWLWSEQLNSELLQLQGYINIYMYAHICIYILVSSCLTFSHFLWIMNAAFFHWSISGTGIAISASAYLADSRYFFQSDSI